MLLFFYDYNQLLGKISVVKNSHIGNLSTFGVKGGGDVPGGCVCRPYCLVLKRIWKVRWSGKLNVFLATHPLLADPGEARGCSTNNFVTHSFIHSLID